MFVVLFLIINLYSQFFFSCKLISLHILIIYLFHFTFLLLLFMFFFGNFILTKISNWGKKFIFCN